MYLSRDLGGTEYIVGTVILTMISLSCPTYNSAAVAAEASLLINVSRSELVQNKNEVEVQRNDPSSPLQSIKSFEEWPL